MKMNNNRFVLCALVLGFSFAGCSTVKEKVGGGESTEGMAAAGPTVLNPRVNPDTLELNRNMKAMETMEILAEVKDFSAPVTDVRVKFDQVPMEVTMKSMGGTTWRAELNDEQIQKLAIGNQTTRYEGKIVATNSLGKVAVGEETVSVKIKAPDLSEKAG